jgi:hypothetical protein
MSINDTRPKTPKQSCEPGTVLVAKFTAFYEGRRIRPGTEFEFHGKKIPRWAAIPGSEDAKVKTPRLGDTKPIAAQRAARQKAGAASGQVG